MAMRLRLPHALTPSFADLAFVMPLVYLFGVMNGARTLLGDGDTGWHVRTGEWILDHAQVPHRDPFSFTRPGAPWTAWEWLWDLAFGFLHRHGGMPAVVLVNAALLAAVFALLYRIALRRSRSVFLAVGCTLAAAAASTVHWLARPHLVTLLLTLVFVRLLDAARSGRTRLLWTLPPLTALWTNLHGGFFVGMFLVGAYAAGQAAEDAARGAGRTAVWRAARPYAQTGLLCAAATFLNPYGPALHAHLWGFLTDSSLYRGIQEFETVSFHLGVARYFEILLVAGVAAVCWEIAHRRFTSALVLLPWVHLGLYAARNIPIYCALAAPVVAGAAADCLAGTRRGRVLLSAGTPWLELERLPRVHAVSLAVLALLAAGLWSPHPPARFRPDYDPARYPTRAVAYLRSIEPDGGVFTHDEWGDFLIYSLYPRTKVYVDGRSDFYGAAFEKEYERILQVGTGWEAALLRHGVATVMMPVRTPLTGALKESSRWRAVYDDGLAIIFRRSARRDRFPPLAGGMGRDREITKTATRGWEGARP